jgi:hypothetical protein
VHVKISDHFWNEVSQNDVNFEQVEKGVHIHEKWYLGGSIFFLLPLAQHCTQIAIIIDSFQ